MVGSRGQNVFCDNWVPKQNSPVEQDIEHPTMVQALNSLLESFFFSDILLDKSSPESIWKGLLK